MEDILRFLELEGGRGTTMSIWEAFFSISVACLCSFVIGVTYRTTHRTPGYSQSFIQTVALISMITSVIMIVIGSNIARAFSLVGAMSIIRFRNAVKETRDVGFLFFGISTGMAAGTRFYSLALLSTGFICGILILMNKLEFGRSKKSPEALLRVQVTAGGQPDSLLRPVLEELCETFSLVSVETAKQGLVLESVYCVQVKEGVEPDTVIEKVSEVNGNHKVLYYLGAHTDPL